MRKAQKERAITATLPAPVGGWNARDSLGDMAPNDAVYLVNLFPGTTSVSQRYGYTQHSTGYSGQVETLMSYSGGSTNKLFAVESNKIYDATGSGAVGAAAVTGLTNSRFQYTNVATVGGNFLLAVNGADKLRGYSGSAWWIDGDGTHDITGVDTATISQINLFKNRVWLVQSNTLNVWYMPISSIAGVATAFPLQGVAKLGGSVVAMGTWTMDAGHGVDDMAVFVTNRGEVIVYRGSDPASASTWELVGVWHVGSPIGKRCLMKFGGDLVLISQDGLLPLSVALQSDRLDTRAALTDKIQSATSSAVSLYGSNFGWQLIQFPKQNMLILNVPVAAGSGQEQYVMNTITKSWCRFTEWEANCWELFGDEIYFGGNGFVGQAWDGLSDNGSNIETDGKQAFNFFGTSNNKRFTLIRPTLLSSGSPAALCGINVNFEDSAPTAALSYAPVTYASWGTALWGTGLWAETLAVIRTWQGLTGIGNCAAVRFKTASSGIQVMWVSTDIVFEKGSIF